MKKLIIAGKEFNSRLFLGTGKFNSNTVMEEAILASGLSLIHIYWERCRQSDAMDFDDLLVYTYLLFRDYPEICGKYAEQFRYVLVGEYQDTNFAQQSMCLLYTSRCVYETAISTLAC